MYVKFENGYAITSNSLKTNLTLADIECKDGCGYHGIMQTWIDLYYDLSVVIKEQLNCNLITTGSICRCRNHNKEVGGSPDSLHTYGLAGDLSLNSKTLVADLKKAVVLASQFFNCVIYYPYNNFMHCDERSTKKTMTMTKTGLKDGFDFTLV